MGRSEKSKGLAPPSIRKDMRAKQARQIITRTIPAILAANPRARKGAESSELIVNPTFEDSNSVNLQPAGQALVKKGEGRQNNKKERRKIDLPKKDDDKEKDGDYDERHEKKKRTMDQGASAASQKNPKLPTDTILQHERSRRIRIMTTDTLTAAMLLQDTKDPKARRNVCILNMASPLRPGGGLLSGATSQEEFLCARTTVLPSLKEEYYRLPEYGGIWTSDVLVFRNALSLDDAHGELSSSQRYWVDVISAGMLRFPDLEGDGEELKALSSTDRAIVERKMRAVLLMATRKRVKRLVLGAWGCGAYGNPVYEIARAWRKALDSPQEQTSRPNERWHGLEEVVFSISNVKMAREFAQAFDSGIELETPNSLQDEEENEERPGENEVVELRTKIESLEEQISHVWNADLKARMEVILNSLRAQLHDSQRESQTASEAEDD